MAESPNYNHQHPPTALLSADQQLLIFDTSVKGMLQSDSNEVNEELPPFFGVVYPNQNRFRIAIEDAKIIQGVHLIQVEGFQGSWLLCFCK